MNELSRPPGTSVRALPPRPNLDHLKNEAKRLLKGLRIVDPATQLSAAQLVLAREYGFSSWGNLKMHVLNDLPLSKQQPNAVEMTRYKSSEWNFELDIPKRWNSFPAVPANSHYEVSRFESHEDGIHRLIIFRLPYDPQQSPHAYSAKRQQILARDGFSNFVTDETAIGSNAVTTLDFDRPLEDGGIWSCRHYFILAGTTLAYTLGFGTNRWDAMTDLFDQMAKSFVASWSGYLHE